MNVKINYLYNEYVITAIEWIVTRKSSREKLMTLLHEQKKVLKVVTLKVTSLQPVKAEIDTFNSKN